MSRPLWSIVLQTSGSGLPWPCGSLRGVRQQSRPASDGGSHPDLATPGPGWIDGWRLTFGGEDLGWEGALTTVAEEPLSHVFVMLYELSEIDEPSLDQWEGSDIGLCRKIRVRVHTLDSDVTAAWLYVLDAYEGGLPSAHTVGIIADAAEVAGAPDDYVADLRSRPCRNIGP